MTHQKKYNIRAWPHTVRRPRIYVLNTYPGNALTTRKLHNAPGITSYEYLPVTIQANGRQNVGTRTTGANAFRAGRWQTSVGCGQYGIDDGSGRRNLNLIRRRLLHERKAHVQSRSRQSQCRRRHRHGLRYPERLGHAGMNTPLNSLFPPERKSG